MLAISRKELRLEKRKDVAIKSRVVDGEMLPLVSRVLTADRGSCWCVLAVRRDSEVARFEFGQFEPGPRSQLEAATSIKNSRGGMDQGARQGAASEWAHITCGSHRIRLHW